METMGAEIAPVASGSRTLKDAVNEALRDYAESFPDTHYVIGSALGPAPYPDMAREFQAVIGRETEKQLAAIGVVPDALVACVGGGSNSIGFFAPFIARDKPRLVGVEAGGRGTGPGMNAARMSGDGKPAIAQGYKSLFLTDGDGQLLPTHSVSAGLDYPGIGPQLASLGRTGRIEFATVSDAETIEAVKFFARNEGIVFALESAHAGAQVLKLAPSMPKSASIVVNMSGRGDKDIFITARALGGKPWAEFLKREAGIEA